MKKKIFIITGMILCILAGIVIVPSVIRTRQAVKEFEKRKQEGRLPEVIDKTHKIGRFLGDEYCEMRFKFSK